MHDEQNHHARGGHVHHHEGGDHARTHPAPTTLRALLVELREHVPFSVSSVAVGLMLAGILCVLVAAFGEQTSEPVEHAGHGHDHGVEANPYGTSFFHLFHPAHMLFSAAATTAMFVRYEKKYLKATIVGLLGATVVCGLSDIAMPHASLMILGADIPLHICLVEHPDLVVPFATIGVLMGLWAASGVQRATLMYHAMHVFVSTMASIFYMVSPLGVTEWIAQIGRVFLFIIPAVVVPCCLSDIVFPMLMVTASRERYFQTPHVH